MRKFEFIKEDSYLYLSLKAADIIMQQINHLPCGVLGLATGSTPVGIYRALVDGCNKRKVDMSRITTFNLDEYIGLGGNDIQSYRYFMDEHLFSKINIPRSSTHIPNGLVDDPDAEAARYEKEIDLAGGIDLQLLGLGPNGHIGFNEPGEAFVPQTHRVILKDSTIRANSRFFSSESNVPREAITVGIYQIMQARHVLLAVCGKNKAKILDEALHGPITPRVPASILQLHPHLTVIYTDEEC